MRSGWIVFNFFELKIRDDLHVDSHLFGIENILMGIFYLFEWKSENDLINRRSVKNVLVIVEGADNLYVFIDGITRAFFVSRSFQAAEYPISRFRCIFDSFNEINGSLPSTNNQNIAGVVVSTSVIGQELVHSTLEAQRKRML